MHSIIELFVTNKKGNLILRLRKVGARFGQGLGKVWEKARFGQGLGRQGLGEVWAS